MSWARRRKLRVAARSRAVVGRKAHSPSSMLMLVDFVFEGFRQNHGHSSCCLASVHYSPDTRYLDLTVFDECCLASVHYSPDTRYLDLTVFDECIHRVFGARMGHEIQSCLIMSNQNAEAAR